MPNPYEAQPPKAFWRSAVGERNPLEITDLWSPKFSLEKDQPVATLGSCFAQHISKALLAAGYSWLNSEPAPVKFPQHLKSEFHYDVFSARVGNIYTTALLKQWVLWAFDLQSPSPEVWEGNARFFDPFRPGIEPDGFASASEVMAARACTLRAIRGMFEQCHTLIFTLGLTEAWFNVDDQVVYPMCPGTLAGQFSAARHQFRNYSYSEIHRDLDEVLSIVRQHNHAVKFLLTVSPVPLTATATEDHVLVATSYSKSTLRAVAGDLSTRRDDVDYFPSYEMISAFPFKGMFYEPNMRSVSKAGVDFVMKSFIGALHANDAAGRDSPQTVQVSGSSSPTDIQVVDEVCEEMILDAFRKTES
jgi:hypothetical protein